MAKLQPVHCRLCGQLIDRNVGQEGTDWIIRSRGWYYHKDCYESWVSSKDDIHSQKKESEWMDYAWDFLTHDVKISVDYIKFQKQWEAFVKKNMTPKGIYFCLKYFYDIQHGDKDKAKGGIGIVSFIYKEGCQYWVDREQKDNGIMKSIEAQLKQKAAERSIVIQAQPKKKKVKMIDLGDIEDGNS